MYLIEDGIHCRLIAWHRGLVTVPARLRVRDPAIEVPPAQLVSRKKADDISPARLCHHLALARRGRIAPPISVEPLDDAGRSAWAGYAVLPALDVGVKVLLEGCP